MRQEDKNLLIEFKQRLPADVKAHLKQLIAFGSRARGDSLPDSDLDVVALVDEKTDEIKRKMDDIIYQIELDHDFNPVISLKIFSESKFQDSLKDGFSFYLHVMQEGIHI